MSKIARYGLVLMVGALAGEARPAVAQEGEEPEGSVSEAIPGEEGTSDEAVVDEAAVDEAAVDEAAVDEAAVDEAAVDEAAVDEAAVDEAGVDEAGVDEAASGPGEEELALAAEVTEGMRSAARRCDENEAMGCLELGAHYLSGDGVTADVAHAEYLRRRASEGLWHACDGGDESACTAWRENFGDE